VKDFFFFVRFNKRKKLVKLRILSRSANRNLRWLTNHSRISNQSISS